VQSTNKQQLGEIRKKQWLEPNHVAQLSLWGFGGRVTRTNFHSRKWVSVWSCCQVENRPVTVLGIKWARSFGALKGKSWARPGKNEGRHSFLQEPCPWWISLHQGRNDVPLTLLSFREMQWFSNVGQGMGYVGIIYSICL
jgi:hypothetical protein